MVVVVLFVTMTISDVVLVLLLLLASRMQEAGSAEHCKEASLAV